MHLLLLRHAEAEPPREPDFERELTPAGIEQAKMVGRYITRRRVHPQLILTSPYQRTIQTGYYAGEAMGAGEIQIEPFLASGMTPETAFAELAAYAEVDCLLVVGHQPDMGYLFAELVGPQDAYGHDFALATLAAVQVDVLAPGGASLEYFVSWEKMRAVVTPPRR
jgi:phosphohistidine phosphatase